MAREKSNFIVGVAVSEIHGQPDGFELLIGYSDGREIGKYVERKTLQKMSEEIRRALGDA